MKNLTKMSGLYLRIYLGLAIISQTIIVAGELSSNPSIDIITPDVSRRNTAASTVPTQSTPISSPQLITAQDDPYAAATLQYDFAVSLLNRKLYSEAEAEFTKFMQNFRDHRLFSEALRLRGETRYAQKRYNEAGLDFRDYIIRYPQSSYSNNTRLRLGECFLELDRYADAVQTLTPLVAPTESQRETYAAAQFILGRCYREMRDYTKAIAVFDAIPDSPYSALASYLKAETALRKADNSAAIRYYKEFVDRYPNDQLAAPARLQLGEIAYASADYNTAESAFRNALGNYPANSDSYYQAQKGLAWTLAAKSDNNNAYKIAETLINNPQTEIAHSAKFLCGFIAFKRGDNTLAAHWLRQVGDGANSEEALRLLAWAYLALDNTTETLRSVEEHRQRFPRQGPRAEIDYIAGKAHLLRQEWREAARNLRIARDARSAYQTEAAFELAVAEEKQLETMPQRAPLASEAYAYFITNYPNDPRVLECLLGQARCLLVSQSYAAALPIFVAIEQYPNATLEIREMALSQQAACYYQLKQYDNMRKAYEHLLEKNPQSQLAIEAKFWIAWHEQNNKRYQAAAELYLAVEKSAPDSTLAIQARNNRAICLFQAGDKAEAAVVLQDIVNRELEQGVSTLDVQEMLWLGQFWMEQRELERASAIYSEILKLSPPPAVRQAVLFFQADIFKNKQNWQQAADCYEQLLRIEDTGLENKARLGLSECLRMLNRPAEASNIINAARLGADDPTIMSFLLEQGLAYLANNDYTAAIDPLMRVGLLSDIPELAAPALLAAAESCLRMGDRNKAKLCLQELAGDTPDSFGTRHPELVEVQQAKQILAKFDLATNTLENNAVFVNPTQPKTETPETTSVVEVN